MCDALKKISNNIQMMSEAEIEDIQSSKLQMLVDAGFAQNPSDAMDRLRDFAVQLSSLKIAQRAFPLAVRLLTMSGQRTGTALTGWPGTSGRLERTLRLTAFPCATP
jgi:hypothetical protein